MALTCVIYITLYAGLQIEGFMSHILKNKKVITVTSTSTSPRASKSLVQTHIYITQKPA